MESVCYARTGIGLPEFLAFSLYQAVQRIGTCSGLSNKLEETNEEETKLLSGLQDLIEDLLFRLGQWFCILRQEYYLQYITIIPPLFNLN